MPPVKRTPRNSVNDRPSGKLLLLRRLRRHMKAFAIGASALVVGLALVGISSSIAARSGRTLNGFRDRFGVLAAASGLRVDEIRFEGNHNTPEPLLRAALGVSKGDPILNLSLDDARANLERIPWVEKATVERRLPGTVIVNIEERRPIAIWQNQDKLYLVDATGQVVTNEELSAFNFLPRIVGAGAPAAAASLLDLLRARPALADKVFASVRVGQRRWNLRLNNGTDVMLPEGHEEAAMDRLMQLEDQHQLLERPLAAIDMRLPDRLSFRPRDAAANGKDPLKDLQPPASVSGQAVDTQSIPVPPVPPPAPKKPT